MINKVAFTSKASLVGDIAKAAETEVIRASSIIEKEAPKVVKEAPKAAPEIYTSPFAATGVFPSVEPPVEGSILNIFG